MRILIADDHEVIRRTVIRIFEMRPDIECTEAENGREAVEKALELKPDLVVLDIRMPDLGGLEAAKQIKRHLPEIPVLFFSIHDTDDILAQATIGEGVIVKDQAATVLLKAVDALLRKETFFPVE